MKLQNQSGGLPSLAHFALSDMKTYLELVIVN